MEEISQTDWDLEILPDWVASGTDTEAFLAWLLNDDTQPWDMMELSVIKVPQKTFLFLYLGHKKKKQCLCLNTRLEFAGLFCQSNYELYDVSELLKDSLGISEEYTFLCKEKAAAHMEQEVSEKIFDMITYHWDEILSEKRYETSQLLPSLRREDVRSMAERFYLEGLTAEEVFFKPLFTFGRMLSDSYYLLYLEHGLHMVNAMARHWIRKRVPDLSKQRILYGCIKEEMRQIPTEGRLFKIRQIRGMLAGLDDETVLVEFGKEEKVVCVRMKAAYLMEPRGQYPLTCLAPRERAIVKKLYGKSVLEGLRVEDVQSVTHNRKVLYSVCEEQEAA